MINQKIKLWLLSKEADMIKEMKTLKADSLRFTYLTGKQRMIEEIYSKILIEENKK